MIINGAIEVGTGRCREGLHALPKTMFDIFLKAVGSFFEGGDKSCPYVGSFDIFIKAVGLFFEGGDKPRPYGGGVLQSL